MGRAIAVRFAGEGANVAINSAHNTALANAVADIIGPGYKAYTDQPNVANESARTNMVKQVINVSVKLMP